MAVRERTRKRLLASAGVFAVAVAVVGTAVYWWAVRERKRRGGGRGGGSASTGETIGAPSVDESARGGVLLDALIGKLRAAKGKEKVSITISMKNIILWNPSPDPQTPNHAFIEGALPFLLALVSSPYYIVHLIMVVSSDKEQQYIERLLQKSNLYTSGLDKRRVLFCETEEGKAHIVRSISPALHMDNNDSVIRMVSPFVNVALRVRKRLRQSSISTPTPRPSSSAAADLTRPDGHKPSTTSQPSSTNSSGMTISNRPTTPDIPIIRIATPPLMSHSPSAPPFTTPSTAQSSNGKSSLPRTDTLTSLSSATTLTPRRGSFSSIATGTSVGGGSSNLTVATLSSGVESGSESETDDLVKLGNVKFVPSLVESGLLEYSEIGFGGRRRGVSGGGGVNG
ncbi:hypothetical protein HDV00_003530 [Rhizophlyctis rosea]|nr:hypothetical protein HDV00_003530 [Rhizophlyctis rosea]